MADTQNLSSTERIKQQSDGLRGTIKQSLANEITGAADNDIDFIAAMRDLGIVPARRVEFHGEGTVLEQRDGTFLMRFR